jgi:hypothetical protein
MHLQHVCVRYALQCTVAGDFTFCHNGVQFYISDTPPWHMLSMYANKNIRVLQQSSVAVSAHTGQISVDI